MSINNLDSLELLNSLPDLAFLLGENGIILEIGKVKVEYQTLMPVGSVGENISNILPSRLVELINNNIRNLQISEESSPKELQISLNDRIKDYEIYVSVCSKNIFLCIIRDISVRKGIEADTQSFIEKLLVNLPVAVFVKKATDGSFVYWNRVHENLMGIKSNDAIYKTDFDFFPKEQAEWFQKKDRETLLKGLVEIISEEPIDTPHLGRRVLRTIKAPIYDGQGRPLYLLGIAEDITIAKKNEEELEKHRKNLQELLDEQNASLKYASKIQKAILPPDKEVIKSLQSYFILSKPKDIVSGDFYWITHKDEKVIIAVSDCTGHGVPGAFLSILGISFLNEIINRTFYLRANEILNQLRVQIIKSLHQTGRNDVTRDGMEIALVILDFEKQKLQYSGAFRPMILIQNNELKEFKADTIPIGIDEQEDQSFSNTELKINKDDLIYLFTDGYIDQLGGLEHKRFRTENFKNLLVEIQKLPMNEQKTILENKFLEWQGKNDQVDDVMIMGIRI
ncbi:MAG TPA: SpoIIE family protein phosphatase [Bacteroidales bacterium]|nr:SpoIIE family protein phosphatase [Bacteroidales bacterium]HUX97492.1 SpoIIE family protein phosphatase [Bacteroidales bacterium]